MSDETPPPSLRLKPRQRPEGEAPAADSAPPANPAAEPETSKLRLKPKLTIEPEPAAQENSAQEPVAPPAEKIRLKPKMTAEPAEQVAEAAPAPEAAAGQEAGAVPPPLPDAPPPEEGKMKLKIKIPGAAIEAAADEAARTGATPPPFPTAMPSLSGNTNPPITIRPAGSRPVPGTRPGGTRPGPPGRRMAPAAAAASARRNKIVKLLLVGLGAVGLAAGIIFIAMIKFIDPVPPLPSHVPPPRSVAPVTHAPTPTPEEEEPAPDKIEQSQRPEPKPGATTTTSATTDLAPGVTVTTEAVEAEIEANPAFRTFVADAKISGVFQGTPARAFINGRLIRAGETVDSALTIVFDSVDAASKTIVFTDSTGAKVSRRY